MEGDLTMENFSIDVDKLPNSHKIALIQRVLTMTSRDIKLFASSWAPPAWMTRENSTINCHLKGEPGDENWEALALYYSKFFTAYKKEGINFWAMTVQNEPEKSLLAFAKWQTLRITPAEERDFIKLNLGPMLAKNHPDLKIIANDDQKPSILTRLEPLEDPESLQYISGVAVHWYRNVDFILRMGGHFGKLVEFHDLYPNLFILPTEACEGYLPNPLGTGKGTSLRDPDNIWKRGENYGRDIIGDLNSYAAGWTDWNLVLNTEGGPGWAKNKVDAPILIDVKNGAEFYKQPMFYFMGHFAKFVPAGSRRIKMVLTADSESELQTCAFVTPENQIVIQFLNLEGSDEMVSVKHSDSSTFTVKVPSHSIVTAILPPSKHTTIKKTK
ncbi:Glycoside hydrolase [Phytophthora megakarya]|uniref:Glycoside hydrolase n=1 Tax=Phytophthora megakarya TaxID=4795 RepID=A0A225WY05_9STRA|nr:Glycoside hydrolase [Phytophthora megakarya]